MIIVWGLHKRTSYLPQCFTVNLTIVIHYCVRTYIALHIITAFVLLGNRMIFREACGNREIMNKYWNHAAATTTNW